MMNILGDEVRHKQLFWISFVPPGAVNIGNVVVRFIVVKGVVDAARWW
jgi:hypothetical protein